MSEDVWASATFLDAVGNDLTTATTPEQAYGITQSKTSTGDITVALVLPRVSDPTTLLSEDSPPAESRT